MTPEELVTVACPQINTMGPAFYFVPDTFARGEELGLDGISFYVLGRGGVLGDVDAGVIASAFGYFNPTLVATMWDAARKAAAPRDAGHAFMECSAAFGRKNFGTLDGLDAFCQAAGAVNDAADATGLALYAAVAAEPLADDLPGRAMQLVTVLREFRGSAHLIALRASDLEAKKAHYIRRPNDGALFGWSEDDAPIITDADRAAWQAAVLDDAGRQALVAGLDAMESKLSAA
jgi:hypothetical protein